MVLAVCLGGFEGFDGFDGFDGFGSMSVWFWRFW